jgi:hypothetical protein
MILLITAQSKALALFDNNTIYGRVAGGELENWKGATE